MNSEDPPRNHRVIPATCATHRGPARFCNLRVSKLDGNIQLDPHATGVCVLTLDEDATTTLRDTLSGWLG